MRVMRVALATRPMRKPRGPTGAVAWQVLLAAPSCTPPPAPAATLRLLSTVRARTRRAAAFAALCAYPCAPPRWLFVRGPGERGNAAAPACVLEALRRGGGNAANQAAAQAARVATRAQAKAAATRRARRAEASCTPSCTPAP